MARVKTVKILGETITIRFCLAVEEKFEQVNGGVPFTPELLKGIKYTIDLYYAAIVTAKPDTAITRERIVHEATGKEIVDLRDAVMETLTAWTEGLADDKEEGTDENP